MALRVLLADESATIKKVIQLSLQDFAVEVKTVGLGTEVITVAESFQPDIIFVDILLQKKNGYDVCQELKSHHVLGQVPVVLMWSGFMELDQSKVKQSKVDQVLEKPFDAEKIRDVVRTLVAKTQQNTLSNFLQMPEIEPEPAAAPKQNFAAAPAPASVPTPVTSVTAKTTTAESPTNKWTMDSFEDLPEVDFGEPINVAALGGRSDSSDSDFEPLADEPEEFVSKPLHNLSAPNLSKSKETGSHSLESMDPHMDQHGDPHTDQWQQKTVNPYTLDLPPEAQFDEVTVNFKPNEDKFENTNFLLNFADLEKDIEKAEQESAPTAHAPTLEPIKAPAKKDIELKPDDSTHSTQSSALSGTLNEKAVSEKSLSEEALEKILREHSKDVIERLILKIVPEIATDLIKKELQRLLDDPKI